VTGQPSGQLKQGMVAAAGGPLAQLTELVPLSQPPGQPELGDVVPGVGQRADDPDGLLSPGPVRQPAGQLPPGMLVSGFGPLAECADLVVFGQLVSPPPPFRVFRGAAQRMGHRNSLAKTGTLGRDRCPAAPPGRDPRQVLTLRHAGNGPVPIDHRRGPALTGTHPGENHPAPGTVARP